jgi:AcrR family transcriptional regulator
LHTRIQMALKTKPASSLNARKTPGQKRSVATVAAILEAAARILETRGLDSYSTNEVAARAGVSIGSLYQYFPSKDAITRALIGRGAEELLADIKTVEIGDVPQAALEQIIDAAVKHQLRRPALARLLDLEEIRLPMGEDFQRAGREAMQIFQSCLTASGMVTPANLAVTSHDLFAIIKGLVDSAGQRGEMDQPALAARVRRAVFGYLTYTGSTSPSPPSKSIAAQRFCHP